MIGAAPESDWHWLAIAQHHGMATRLLDWTDNPLAALWFAVENDPVPDKKGVLGHGVLWAFHVFDEDTVTVAGKETPFSGKRTKVFQPSHITRTIVVQGGWFTVHKYIAEEQRFIPLEKNRIYKKHLRKLTVPPDYFSKLKEQLDKCGVNAVSMFPELRGLCDYLNSKWLPA